MSYFPTSFRLVAKPKNYEQTKDICEKSGDDDYEETLAERMEEWRESEDLDADED